MRKLVSILCCFNLIFCCLPIAFADENGKSAIDDLQSEALDMLTALGIMEDFDESSFDPDKEITRGEFACFAAKLIRADEASTRVYFYDVPENHYACAAVAALVEKNVVNGDGTKLFNPDEVMSLNDAYTIIVRLLSYNKYADANGGYPMGYLMTARRLKLLDNSVSDSVLTMKTAIVLMKNALLTPIMDIYSIEVSSGTVAYRETGETLLSVYFDAYYNEGIVTAMKNKGVYGAKALKENEIEIDNLKYTVTDINELFFGREVGYIYSETKSGERTIIWMRTTENDDAVTLFSTENECVFNSSNMEIEYYSDEQKKRTVRISDGATVIYNGENYSGEIEAIFQNEQYELKLISTEGTSLYDIMDVTAYDTFMVETINGTDMKVYGDGGQEYCLDSNKVDYVDIYNGNDEKIGFADIAEKNILSIARSQSGKSIKALQSTKTVSGKISRVTKNGNHTIVDVDGVEYSCYRDVAEAKLIAGANVELYLDIFSYVYDIKASVGDGMLAYIINLVESDNGFDSVLKLKLLSEDGSIAGYETAEKVKIDMLTYKNPDEAAAVLKENGKIKAQLIKCKMNGNGKITAIDTVATEDGLRTDQARKSNLLYKNNCSKLGTKIIVNSDTKVFCVPDDSAIDSADDSEFAVKSKSEFNNDTNYDAESYIMEGSEDGFADAVVVHGYNWGASMYWTLHTLVNKVYTTINDEGIIVDCLEGYQAEKPVRLVCAEDYSFKDVMPGDIVKTTRNKEGYVSKLDLVYRPGMSVDTSNYANTFNASARTLRVKANDKFGSVVKVGYASGADYDEVFNLGTVPILIFDASARNDNYVSKGTCGDILTYKMEPDKCSTLFIQGSYGAISFVVIYRD